MSILSPSPGLGKVSWFCRAPTLTQVTVSHWSRWRRKNQAGFTQGRELSGELSDKGFIIKIKPYSTVERAEKMNIQKGRLNCQRSHQPVDLRNHSGNQPLCLANNVWSLRDTGKEGVSFVVLKLNILWRVWWLSQSERPVIWKKSWSWGKGK